MVKYLAYHKQAQVLGVAEGKDLMYARAMLKQSFQVLTPLKPVVGAKLPGLL